MPPQIKHKVQFVGAMAQDDLPAALASAAVCTYPSFSEAHSVACLEGMAMGRAVLASDVPPFQEIVNPGVDGLLCDPHNPRAIAANLIRLLTDPTLRRTLGATARRLAVDRYSVQHIVEQNIEFYMDCRYYSHANQAA